MSVPRCYLASSFLSWDELWVSGGLDNDDTTQIAQTSSEKLKAGESSFNNYVPLYEDLHYHVTVRINESAVVSIAGQGSSPRVRMFIKETEAWIPLPDLQEGRYAPFAGLVQYDDGRKKIIVTGGQSSVDLSSTEELDIQDPGAQWVPGRPLPHKWREGASVQYKNTFLAMGGRWHDGSAYHNSDFIYEYDTDTDSWITRTERLATERCHLAAFLVPDSIANCN